MNWWSSNQSNMINGTDGAVFHPLINRNELLYIFAADLCRYVGTASVVIKLLATRSGRVRPRTSGYCLVCQEVVIFVQIRMIKHLRTGHLFTQSHDIAQSMARNGYFLLLLSSQVNPPCLCGRRRGERHSGVPICTP